MENAWHWRWRAHGLAVFSVWPNCKPQANFRLIFPENSGTCGIVREESSRQGFCQEVFHFPLGLVAFIKHHTIFPLDNKIKKISVQSFKVGGGGFPPFCKSNMTAALCQDFLEKSLGSPGIKNISKKDWLRRCQVSIYLWWKINGLLDPFDGPTQSVKRKNTISKCASNSVAFLARKSSVAWKNSKRNIWKIACETCRHRVILSHAKRDDGKASGWVCRRIFRAQQNALPRVFDSCVALQNGNEA